MLVLSFPMSKTLNSVKYETSYLNFQIKAIQEKYLIL